MKTITLTQNQVALVDDDIFNYLNQFKWFAKKHHSTFYAVRNIRKENGKQTALYLHHLVIGKPIKPLEIDHIDLNGLNNQRTNLQIVTHQQNRQNNYRKYNKIRIVDSIGMKQYQKDYYLNHKV